MTKTRTAIFGGSFNPIHKGHIALAKQIIKENLADEVWLMVSPQNPLKNNQDLMDEKIRLHLAQLGVKNEHGIKASDFEFHLPRPSYTWDTLTALSKTYPDRQFSLVIGADNWKIFDKWAHYTSLIENYSIIIYPRKGYEFEVETLPQSVQYMSAPLYPYSSTEVRKALYTLKSMLPQEVLQEFVNNILG